jgi:hypothetical protein
MRLTEEQIFDVLTKNIENVTILNCRWIEDKEFWAINIKTEYGINVQELINICNDLEIDTDFVFIDADEYNSFRISIFEQ